MNYLASLLLPATLGLVAGMAHGIVSHTMGLPVSLGEQVEQVVEPLGTVQPLRD
ncbi:MAG: hypothetical protein AAFP20_16295 [Cyanobacteria bacterium J06614_10]